MISIHYSRYSNKTSLESPSLQQIVDCDIERLMSEHQPRAVFLIEDNVLSGGTLIEVGQLCATEGINPFFCPEYLGTGRLAGEIKKSGAMAPDFAERELCELLGTPWCVE